MIQRNTPLARVSKKKLEELGFTPSSTLRRHTPLTNRKRPTGKRTDTGPTKAVRDLVRERSGGLCEWPGCHAWATDKQHRLGRKAGGRHGAMRELLNGPAWLLDICRLHHIQITSASGFVLEEAKEMGWVLMEHQSARVPVLTRHSQRKIELFDDGTFERACA